MKAKVLKNRLVVYKKPGSPRYLTWLEKGDIVDIVEGFRYDDRPWKDKRYVKVQLEDSREGFCIAGGLSPIGANQNEKNNNG